MMGIEYRDVDDILRIVELSGRLDLKGATEIELEFSSLTTTAHRRFLVDLKQVNFLSSMGIRSLISNAKTLHQRHGKMVLVVEADSAVAKTLESTGINELVPVFTNSDEAHQALAG